MNVPEDSEAGALRATSLPADGVRSEAVRGDGLRSEAVRGDAVRGDAVRGDAVRGDALRSDIGELSRGEVAGGDVASDGARSDATWVSPGRAEPLADLLSPELRASELELTGPATMASGTLAAQASAGPPSSSRGERLARAQATAVQEAEPIDLDPLDVEDVLEEPLAEAGGAADDYAGLPENGFQAFLRHANLHNLLQIESLSRTTGVFLVVSGGSRGYLHLNEGELVHAETGQASGEEAAAEILSWQTGEFKSCARTVAPVRTVHCSVQSLLMRLAQASDEAAQGARRHQSSRVVRRPLDQEAPTETYLPPIPPAAPLPTGVSPAGVSPGTAEPAGRAHGSSPPVMPPVSAAGPPSQRPSLLSQRSAQASRSEPTSVADVLLSAAGEVIHGRGAATEEFAARVAYATRLAELIGRAIRSGTPKGLELRGKSTQTVVQWQADGTLSASLDLAQPPRR